MPVGRPALSPDGPRSRVISAQISEATYRRLATIAEESGATVSRLLHGHLMALADAGEATPVDHRALRPVASATGPVHAVKVALSDVERARVLQATDVIHVTMSGLIRLAVQRAIDATDTSQRTRAS